jgi:hypothetical protein
MASTGKHFTLVARHQCLFDEAQTRADSRNIQHPTPNIQHPLHRSSRGGNACATLPKLYRQTAVDFCKCLIEHSTFTGTLPFLYRFSFLTTEFGNKDALAQKGPRGKKHKYPFLFLPQMTKRDQK